jgi:hypothetical protein
VVDGDRVMDAVTDGVVDCREVVDGMEAVDGMEVLDIDEVVALLDSEEDMVLVVFDKVTSPAPSC